MGIIEEKIRKSAPLYRVGILTCSSSRTKKEEDFSARVLEELLNPNAPQGSMGKISKKNPHRAQIQEECCYKIVKHEIVPDHFKTIAQTLKDWCDSEKIDLILTTGGTGFSSTDITPEATCSILEKEAPNLSQAMRFFSNSKNKLVPFLSRGVCGSRKKSLILNLPGSPRGAQESLEAVLPLVPHILKLITQS